MCVYLDKHSVLALINNNIIINFCYYSLLNIIIITALAKIVILYFICLNDSSSTALPLSSLSTVLFHLLINNGTHCYVAIATSVVEK